MLCGFESLRPAIGFATDIARKSALFGQRLQKLDLQRRNHPSADGAHRGIPSHSGGTGLPLCECQAGEADRLRLQVRRVAGR